MRILMLAALFLIVGRCSAAPGQYAQQVRSVETAVPTVIQQVRTVSNHVPIVQQVRQSNEDGTYAFGYESADGSFRSETRDVDGFVSGQYGYINPDGQRVEFDYVAGARSGIPVGFQIRSSTGLDSFRSLVGSSGYSTPQIRVVQQPARQIIVQQQQPTVIRSVANTGAYSPGQQQIRLVQQPQPARQIIVQEQQQPVVIQQQPARQLFVQQPQQVIVQQPARQLVVQQPQVTEQFQFVQQEPARQFVVQQEPARQFIVQQPQTVANQVVVQQQEPIVESRQLFAVQQQPAASQFVVQQPQAARQFVVQQQPQTVRQLFTQQPVTQQVVLQPQATTSRQLFFQQQPAEQVFTVAQPSVIQSAGQVNFGTAARQFVDAGSDSISIVPNTVDVAADANNFVTLNAAGAY